MNIEDIKEAIYPNQYINLSRLDLDIELPDISFYITEIKFTHDDKIKITAKEII
jgi:rubrerythrin